MFVICTDFKYMQWDYWRRCNGRENTSTKPVLFPAAIRHLFIFQFPVDGFLKNIIKTPFTPELHNPGTMKRHQSLFYLGS